MTLSPKSILHGAQEREAAFAEFAKYMRAQPLAERLHLRRKYEDERGNLKGGVMRYMRLSGNLTPR